MYGTLPPTGQSAQFTRSSVIVKYSTIKDYWLMLSTSSPVADDTPVPHDWKQGVLRIVGMTLHLKVSPT